MSQRIRFAVHRLCLISTILFATVGCDQTTKVLVRDSLPALGSLSYLNDIIQLTYARNPGIFMSWGAGLSSTLRFWIFNIAVSIMLLGLAYAVFFKKVRPIVLVGLTLMLGGGLGNLIDRFLFGSVTDFIFLSAGPLHTGIFNIADVAIVCGGLCLLIPKRKLRLFHYSFQFH